MNQQATAPQAETGETTATLDAILREESQASLEFSLSLWDPRYQVEPFHRWLIGWLERLQRREVRRLIINSPPRHGKSRLAAIEFPAWILGNDPAQRIIAASYSGHLSAKHSMECLERIRSKSYQMSFPDVRLSGVKQRTSDWMTTAGGGYLASSVTGSTTGLGADILIVDDPIKDFAEAHSEVMREAVWNWFLSTATTRLSPDGCVIIIMTRWHEDDLVGRLTDPKRIAELEELGGASENYTVLNVPAIAEAGDPMGRQPGEALSPGRYPLPRLKAIRASIGSYLWSALYGGRPTPKGGNYIKGSNFKIVSRDAVPAGLRWMRFWDLAATTKKKSDFTASIAGAYGPTPAAWADWKRRQFNSPDPVHNCLYLRDMIRGKWIWPESRERIKQTAEMEKILIGVEAVAGFRTSYDNLREVLPASIACMPVEVSNDKLTRALPWIAETDAKGADGRPDGLVYLVAGDWVQGFISEAEAFPSGLHDDQVDAVSGVRAMLKSGRMILVA